MNRNGNFYQAPNPNSGCFNCGSPTRRARECPVPSAERRRPEQQSTPLPQPSTQQQPDVRPMKDRSNKQEKTCIRVKYRQHKLNALIDTGSDVSIAGEDIARNLGWTIHSHHTKEVSVANNKTMSILGAARVVLIVAGHGVESEILIAPDVDGLILGIDWLHSQGGVRWDFDGGKIKFGKRNWIELQRETEQPCRTSIIRKGFSMADRRIGSHRSDFHAAPLGSARRFCCSKLNRKFLHEVSLFCCAMHLVESGRERGKACGPGARQCVSDARRRIRDDVLPTLSQYPPCLPNLWTSYLIVRSARRTLWLLLHFRPNSATSMTASTEEDTKTRKDPADLEHSKELQNNEGKTPGMSSAIRIVSPRRDGILTGELGPYIPASPVKDLSTWLNVDEARSFEAKDSEWSRDSMTRSVRAAGEAQFGDAESVDEWMTPSPVLGVAAESVDRSTTPPPVFQSERNQLDVSPGSIDGKMTTARAELMETAELSESSRGACPLLDGVLDTVEGHLQQTTDSSEVGHLRKLQKVLKLQPLLYW